MVELRVSVVIPSYNAEETIISCLEAIVYQDFAYPYEVIVVDSSVDNTPTLVQEQFPAVRFIHLTRRTWSGTARNIGASEAQGEVLAFLDSDCVVCPKWLSYIESALRDGHAAVGGPVLNGNPKSLVSWTGYFNEFSEWFPGRAEGLVRHVPSCNIAYQREVFESFGGFADELYLYVDHHLNWRLSQQGEKILFTPAMWVRHYHRTTLRSFFSHQWARGKYGARVRALVPLPDSFTLRFPLLAPFVFFPKRLIGIGLRTLQYHPTWVLQLALVSPLLTLGVAIWVAGFVQESRHA